MEVSLVITFLHSFFAFFFYLLNFKYFCVFYLCAFVDYPVLMLGRHTDYKDTSVSHGLTDDVRLKKGALEGPQGQPWRVCRASPGGSAGPALEGLQGQSWRVCRASPGGSAGPVLEGLQGWSWRVSRTNPGGSAD